MISGKKRPNKSSVLSLPIATLDLSRRIQKKLLHNGYYLVDDALQCPEETLATSLAVSHSTVRKIRSQLQFEYETPPLQTLDEIIQEQNETIPSTALPLDTLLGGGFPLCSVTEITGPSGCGKSLLLQVFAQSLPEANIIFLSTQTSPSAHLLSHYTQVAQWFDHLLSNPPVFLLLDNLLPLLKFQDKLIQSRWLHRWGMVLRQLALKKVTVVFTSHLPCGSIAGTQVALHSQDGQIIARLEKSISGVEKKSTIYTIDDLLEHMNKKAQVHQAKT
ncbi:hypothetical protein HMI54_015178 [Coelomomyces lativittatus]|nr:hypothetical protein HMI56_006134 [Coelomomyces lativittatus]KAJ1517884.1 hypothetical protein HMI55_005202 [Coelomomyces lativittatus]KAJ1518537.1 hypothetical protein HMI54_015178 [Coelomomyces lativittatus]